MENEKKSGAGKKVAGGVGVVAVIAALATLGAGRFGLGPGAGLFPAPESPAAAPTQTVEQTADAGESASAGIEIRVQGREYNYGNVTYGNAEHPLDELLAALSDLDPDAPVNLVVEENAAKNAVDDLRDALASAGFTNIRE